MVISTYHVLLFAQLFADLVLLDIVRQNVVNGLVDLKVLHREHFVVNEALLQAPNDSAHGVQSQLIIGLGRKTQAVVLIRQKRN